jgi:hypothetical protein
MSIGNVYKRLSKRADEKMKTTKSADSPSGLLTKSKLDTSTPKSQLNLDDEIVDIIYAIRKQRKELLNGSE